MVSLSLPSRWIESSVLNASGFPIGFHVWKNTLIQATLWQTELWIQGS